MGTEIVSSTLRKVLLAPVNLFFDITPVGKILNIFQSEIHIFRHHLFDPLQHIVGMCSHVVLVCSVMLSLGFWESIIGFTIIGIVMSRYVPYYYAAEKYLCKIGGTIWGPIHSYFYECMRGINVIRAFGQEKEIMKKQHQLLDKTTLHFIAHHSSWCWYNLRMMYSSFLFYILALLLIAKNKGTTDTVTLVLLFNWTSDLHWLMHVPNCVNGFKRNCIQAQRVYNLQNVPQEKIKGVDGKPENWPGDGALEFKDVALRYRPVCERALNGISFKVEAGEKVGVVGRTGAGKSTLFMALTRIVELEEGKIEIDGQDISKVDLKALRNQITMIPQDPTLFTGSLRFNLDPFDQYTDERIHELIKKAGLEYLLDGTSKKEIEDKKKKEEEEKKKKDEVAAAAEGASDSEDSDDEDAKKKKEEEKKKKEEEEKKKSEGKDEKKDDEKKDDEKKDEVLDKEKQRKKLEEEGKGLYFKVQEEGKNLSVGERQLVCIIRAILRCNKLVVLDEATANIDVVTEKAIQKLISEEFDGATVLTIAHRLNTIINSDKVLFLSKGTVLEYDTPKRLLADPTSAFSKLAEDKKRKETKKKVQPQQPLNQA